MIQHHLDKTCPTCKTDYRAKRKTQIFCSPKCQAAGGTAKTMPERICTACDAKYTATSGKQMRCATCIKNKALPKSRIEGAPMCACGCGERVIWSKSFYRWNSYVLGHEGRVRFKTQDFHVNVRMKCSRPHKGKTPKKECIQCKIIFPATYKEKKYCSMACRTLHQRGENHPLYKENRSKYVASRIKNVSKDSINVHILKMEALLNRRLNSTEVVHHIDENKENNSIDNLFLFHCDSCHRHFHSLFSNDKNAELKYKYEDFHKTQKPKSRVYKRHNYTIKDIPNSILAEVLIYMRNKESTSTSNSCDIGGVP